MKIISYNLFHGAINHMDELVEFINNENPDILCLQEANHWEENDCRILREFSERVNMPFTSHNNSNTEHCIITLSKYPFEVDEPILEGFHHGASIILIDKGFNDTDGMFKSKLLVANTHLNPYSEDERLKEIEMIIEYVGNPDISENIILGDLNSVSPFDCGRETLQLLKAEGITKFGTEKLRFDVIYRLHECKYFDHMLAFDDCDYTVPTNSNNDPAHKVELRLDYIFSTLPLLYNFKDVRVVRNELTDRISDHYPVVVELH